jgi:hypothetical protein
MAAQVLSSSSGSVPAITDLSASTTQIADPDEASGDPVNEASGLLVSRKNKASGRIFWSMNDSGGTNTLYAYDETTPFTVIGTYTVTGAVNNDWEDLAQGPGPTSGVNYIYIGNMGSSASDPREIYRVAEPTVNPNQTPVSGNLACDTFTYTSPVSDSEGLMCDPVTGDLFLFEKITNATRPRTCAVYRCPASQLVAGGGSITWTQVATVQDNRQSTNNGGITGADISADGSYIAINNYQEVWIWNRNVAGGETVAQALANAADVYRWYPSGWGAESIAFDTPVQPMRIYTIAEGAGSSLKYVSVVY